MFERKRRNCMMQIKEFSSHSSEQAGPHNSPVRDQSSDGMSSDVLSSALSHLSPATAFVSPKLESDNSMLRYSKRMRWNPPSEKLNEEKQLFNDMLSPVAPPGITMSSTTSTLRLVRSKLICSKEIKKKKRHPRDWKRCQKDSNIDSKKFDQAAGTSEQALIDGLSSLRL